MKLQKLDKRLSLKNKLPEEIAIGILPFLSSLTDGIIKFLPSETILELPRIRDIEFKKIVETVRVGYKQNS